MITQKAIRLISYRFFCSHFMCIYLILETKRKEELINVSFYVHKQINKNELNIWYRFIILCIF